MEVFTLMLLSIAVIGGAYTPEALKDQITNLPGLPAGVTFNQFAGYVDIGSGKQIFYWHVEAQRNVDTAPLVLWSNGGPGCSGLGGFLTEQGPFRPTKDGNLTMNPYAWNQLANMVFIEQPAGVGFSQAPAGMKYGDAEAAADNYAFIKGFLEKFPQYKTRDFFISSESYGGHYMPTLAKQIVTSGGIPNFKGVFVGNPLTYMPYRNYGQFGTFAGHNLLPKPLFDEYLAAGCKEDDSSDKCQEIEQKMLQLTAGMDPYALDFPVCAEATKAGRNERFTLLKHIAKTSKALKGYFPPTYTPCDTQWESEYLNRVDVQTAIHAKVGTKWADCANIDYNQTDVNGPMMPVWKFLIDGGYNLRLHIYSGDDDSVCATLGSQQFIWDMGYKVTSEWAPWTLDSQVAGYLVKFDGFSFSTVHGAGHMVPSTRPAQSLTLFSKFLKGDLN